MIFINNLIPKLFSINGPVAGVTIFPFIFIRKEFKDDERLINHEKIHLEQYKELFFFGFFFIYAWDFILNLINKKNSQDSYFDIRLEKEAYINEDNLDYIKSRKRYSWTKYFR